MKLLPLIVIVSCLALARSVSVSVGLTLAIDGVGFSPGSAIVNSTAFERPPPGPGLNTATPAEPPAAISATPICAVSWVAFTNVVGRSTPFQRTLEPAMKFEPFTVSVKAAPPAGADAGVMVLIDGTGFWPGALIVNLSWFDAPP